MSNQKPLEEQILEKQGQSWFSEEVEMENETSFISWKDALKAMREYAEADKWVPTKDRIPESGQRVLCYNGSRMMENSWEAFTDQNEEWFKRTFTHWQLLINKPKF